MIWLQLFGGEMDGTHLQLDDPPDRPRGAVLVDVPGVAMPWHWRDLVNPTTPVPVRVGVYELVRDPDHQPVRDGNGILRYEWKGIH